MNHWQVVATDQDQDLPPPGQLQIHHHQGLELQTGVEWAQRRNVWIDF